MTTKRQVNLDFVVIATLMGNTLEWFDYATFGYLIPIFAKIFFADQDSSIRISHIFILVAFGSTARPLGGFLFGYIGDRFGRRLALIASILLMAGPTLLIGMLPTYAQIGVISLILLGIMRFLQGCGAGGELPGVMTFLIESSPRNVRSFFGSFAFFGVLLGIFLGTLDFYMIAAQMSVEDLYAWGWRLPFFIGAVLGAFGLYLRSQLKETPLFAETQKIKATVPDPIRETFKLHKTAMLQVFGIVALETVAFNTIFTFSSVYMTEYFGMQVANAAALNMLGLTVGLIFIPIAGKWSLRWGGKRVAMAAAVGLFVLSYPLFTMLSKDNMAMNAFSFSVLAVLLACYEAPLASIFCEIFPTKVRYSGIAIMYNFGIAILGGTTPLIAYHLIQNTQLTTAPSFYLMAAAFVSFLVLSSVKDKQKLFKQY